MCHARTQLQGRPHSGRPLNGRTLLFVLSAQLLSIVELSNEEAGLTCTRLGPALSCKWGIRDLLVFMTDGVRDVYRYSSPITADEIRNNPAAETLLHMKLFRAQRNFYIAGFALFLCLSVILPYFVTSLIQLISFSICYAKTWYTVWNVRKFYTPRMFWHLFFKECKFLSIIIHTYSAFSSTWHCKVSFSYS